jgi:hypothetical protein
MVLARVECGAMMKRLALVMFCLAAPSALGACTVYYSDDYYYAITYPGSHFDPGTQ